MVIAINERSTKNTGHRVHVRMSRTHGKSQRACNYPRTGATKGCLTSAREILIAALMSAFKQKPHCLQRKEAWVCRLACSQCPHWLQVRLVFLGSTNLTGTLAQAAL